MLESAAHQLKSPPGCLCRHLLHSAPAHAHKRTQLAAASSLLDPAHHMAAYGSSGVEARCLRRPANEAQLSLLQLMAAQVLKLVAAASSLLGSAHLTAAQVLKLVAGTG